MSTSGVGYEQLNPPLKAMINAAAGGEGGGAAGSFVVVPRTSTVKLTSDSNKVNIQISDFNKDFDTLLVFKNSVYIGQGVAYDVISNTQIQSIGNSNWVAGTTFQFVCLHVNRAPSVLKCVSIKNEINLTTNSTFIDIGVRDFDKDADTLLLFENGVYMEKDLDYRIDGSKIYPIGDTMFRGTPDCPLVFNMIVLRNVVDPDSVKDFEGSNIKDLTITMNKLTQDIQNILNNPQDRRVGNMSLLRTNSKDTLVNAINEVDDLRKQQIGSLPSLRTNSKDNLVNAINELFQYASNGKTLVANAITGKGVSSNSNMTFQQLATNISNINTGYSREEISNKIPLNVVYNLKYGYLLRDPNGIHPVNISGKDYAWYNESDNIIKFIDAWEVTRFINLNRLVEQGRGYRLESTGYEGLEFIPSKDKSKVNISSTYVSNRTERFVSIFVKQSDTLFSAFSSVPNNYYYKYTYLVLPNDDIVIITGYDEGQPFDQGIYYYECIKSFSY